MARLVGGTKCYKCVFAGCLGCAVLLFFIIRAITDDHAHSVSRAHQQQDRHVNQTPNTTYLQQVSSAHQQQDRHVTQTQNATYLQQVSRSHRDGSGSKTLDASHHQQVEVFPAWTTEQPHDVQPTRRIYLYSALHALYDTTTNGGTHVHIVAIQEGAVQLSMTCCAREIDERGHVHVHTHTVATGTAYTHRHLDRMKHEDMGAVPLTYSCHFPFFSRKDRTLLVTVTSGDCPRDDNGYLAVERPVVKPGGLAVCAKIAYGHELDAKKMVEWLELQKLMGVDTVQLFDLNNTDAVKQVMDHYSQTGLLIVLPFKLPGNPWGRTMKPLSINGNDEELALLDCDLRLAGHQYVMNIDMDEVVMPRHHDRLKPFLKEQFRLYQHSAALFFSVQFFIYEWGPVDREASLTVLRYLNSTAPRWECFKGVYQPPGVKHASTHNVVLRVGYSQHRLASTVATLFHFRQCPQGWRDCHPPRITDTSMRRLQHDLLPRVSGTLQQLNLP